MKRPNMVKRIAINIAIIFIVLILAIGSMALAISNPDSIAIASYKVFENSAETGDMLFAAEIIVDYAVEPTDYDANEAFIFELLNVSGNLTLFAKALNDYGDRPMSFYLSAAQVTAAGISS